MRGDVAEAAIVSRRAATLYGLSVLASDIQNAAYNAARFVILASARYEGYLEAWKGPDLFVDGTPARDYKVGLSRRTNEGCSATRCASCSAR
ncbi:MAG: hypothetical protein M3R07_00755 [Gemmatimonadota bacterium]|nr:hypothetical protein [Gemmatimonadota bacterium]